MKLKLPADKETLIDLPLHIKGKVVDFRRPGNRLAPWDLCNAQQQAAGQNNLFVPIGWPFGGLGSHDEARIKLADKNSGT